MYGAHQRGKKGKGFLFFNFVVIFWQIKFMRNIYIWWSVSIRLTRALHVCLSCSCGDATYFMMFHWVICNATHIQRFKPRQKKNCATFQNENCTQSFMPHKKWQDVNREQYHFRHVRKCRLTKPNTEKFFSFAQPLVTHSPAPSCDFFVLKMKNWSHFLERAKIKKLSSSLI